MLLFCLLLLVISQSGADGANQFEVSAGPCTTSDNCFQSHNYPNDYGFNEICSIKVLDVGTGEKLFSSAFNTEEYWDKLTIRAVLYSGTDGPNNVTVSNGDVMTWRSDGTHSYTGFQVCLFSTCTQTNGYQRNDAACTCGSTTCTAFNGLFCTSSTNTCQLFPTCTLTNGTTPNDAACNCGSTTCTDATGLFCYASNSQCSLVAIPDCGTTDGSVANNVECYCGSTLCTAFNGLFCTSSTNTCQLFPTCTLTDGSAANTGTCLCDSTLCTAETGLICDSLTNQCSASPCDFTNGYQRNDAMCKCGNTTCTAFNGLFCTSSTNTCQLFPTCTLTNGTTPNDAACNCGSTTCTDATGFICYSTVGGGSCRKTDVGTFGYPRAYSGQCTDVNNRNQISDKASCELAARSMGLSDVTAGVAALRDYPIGCFWTERGNLMFNSRDNSPGNCAWFSLFCLCVAADDCTLTDGSAANTGTCKCGSNTCNAEKGLFCYSTVGGGSCRKNADGGSQFEVKSGNCTTVGKCFQSPNYGIGNYGNNNLCSIKVLGVGTGEKLYSIAFDTQKIDKLTIGEDDYSGYVGPNNVTVSTGDVMTWSSDADQSYTGFQVCLFSTCTQTNGYQRNDAACTCGSTTCTAFNGLFCTSSTNTCQLFPTCTQTNGTTPNDAACKCNSTMCTDATGLFCYASNSQCSLVAIPDCGTTDGSVANNVECKCGSTLCTAFNGLFCTSSTNTCQLFPTCTLTDGSAANTSAANTGTCLCDSTLCTAETGLFCDSLTNQCSASPCDFTNGYQRNDAMCKCGNTTCTAFNGLFCTSSTNTCQLFPTCTQTDGTAANDAACKCGSTDCTDATGLFCDSLTNQCSASPCDFTNGYQRNDGTCKCGSTTCNAEQGLFCYSTVGGGSCRKNADGGSQFEVKSGNCTTLGKCFQSPNYGIGNYGNNEVCSIKVLGVGTVEKLYSIAFDTELGSDILMINNFPYSGQYSPNNVTVSNGDVMTWSSDRKESYNTGFQVCLFSTCTQTDGTTPNDAACTCGNTPCTDPYGLFCDSSKMPCTCVNTPCTDATGFICDSSTNQCSASPCDFTNGYQRNDAMCKCGNTTCTAFNGLFCTSSTNTCQLFPTCTQTDGTAANDAACKCGSTDCTDATGLFCDSLINQCGQLCVSGWNEGCFDPSTEGCSIRDMSSCSAAELITIKTLYNNRGQC